jgi:hypothetical protein
MSSRPTVLLPTLCCCPQAVATKQSPSITDLPLDILVYILQHVSGEDRLRPPEKFSGIIDGFGYQVDTSWYR